MKNKTTEGKGRNNWEKGEWLKGMSLSGSQAKYILSNVTSLLSFQRQELLNQIEEEIDNYSSLFDWHEGNDNPYPGDVIREVKEGIIEKLSTLQKGGEK